MQHLPLLLSLQTPVAYRCDKFSFSPIFSFTNLDVCTFNLRRCYEIVRDIVNHHLEIFIVRVDHMKIAAIDGLT